MRKALMMPAVLAAGIALAACGLGGPGAGHSNAYKRGYHDGYERIPADCKSNCSDAEFWNSMFRDPDLQCQIWANDEDIDNQPDYKKGCLAGAAAREKKGNPKH